MKRLAASEADAERQEVAKRCAPSYTHTCVKDPGYVRMREIGRRFCVGLTEDNLTERFWQYIDEVERFMVCAGDEFVSRMFEKKALTHLTKHLLVLVEHARNGIDKDCIPGYRSRTLKLAQIFQMFPASDADRDREGPRLRLLALTKRHNKAAELRKQKEDAELAARGGSKCVWDSDDED